MNTYDYWVCNTKMTKPPAESSLEDYDAEAFYGKDQMDLHRYADLRQEVYDRKKSSIHAAGKLRPVVAEEWFRLENHPDYKKYPQEDREFVIRSGARRCNNGFFLCADVRRTIPATTRAG